MNRLPHVIALLCLCYFVGVRCVVDGDTAGENDTEAAPSTDNSVQSVHIGGPCTGCYVSSKRPISQIDGCIPKEQVYQTSCSGRCYSTSRIDPAYNPFTITESADCCKATTTRNVSVQLSCPEEPSVRTFTMAATCDNEMKVFFDGILQESPASKLNDWPQGSTFTVPSNVRVIGIQCKDVGVVGGILASFSNGMVTDESWQCSPQASRGWLLPSFGGSWSSAYEIGTHGMSPWNTISGISGSAQWIWTRGWHGENKNVYCRKVIEPEMTATCDNKMKVYFDGVLQAAPSAELNNWPQSSKFRVPIGTKVVGIECDDVGVVGGILASFSTGMVTDDTWQCSSRFSPSWASFSFAGNWPSAHKIGKHGMSPWNTISEISSNAQWIWTPGWHGQDTKVFCRKVIVPVSARQYTYSVIDRCSCQGCTDD